MTGRKVKANYRQMDGQTNCQNLIGCRVKANDGQTNFEENTHEYHYESGQS